MLLLEIKCQKKGQDYVGNSKIGFLRDILIHFYLLMPKDPQQKRSPK